MKLPIFDFVKMHGAGNDFVLIDDRSGQFAPIDDSVIAAIANRPDGIGCEGVILLQRSSIADFRMRFFNPDGGEADFCGNGARCIAAFAREIGAVKDDAMIFESAAGLIKAELHNDGRVSVSLPNPIAWQGEFINTGVPHLVVEVANLDGVDVNSEGRRIRYEKRFAPSGTNVDFVEFHPPHLVAIRTYERGVEAESFSCGTGAIAAALIGVANHAIKFPVTVMTRDGEQLIVNGDFTGKEFTQVVLNGPVSRRFSGHFCTERKAPMP